MFHEYDTVRLTRDIRADESANWPEVPTDGVPAGTVGTIVTVYDETDGVYEVEFVGEDGTTLGLTTLTAADVQPL